MKINSIIDLVKDLDTSRQTKNLNKLLIRILLHLQVEFSIKQDVVFLGMDDTVEIWSPRLLEEQRMPAEEFAKELENLMNAPQ